MAKNLLKILKSKPNKLNWEVFNFLENLLVFCAKPTRHAPPESGVHFHITKLTEEDICILFQIDRQRKTTPGKIFDPLIRNPKEARPDYMVFYVNQTQKEPICICTIIEMKGKDEKDLEQGIN